MTGKRESGFYWIRQSLCDPEIAQWDDGADWWWTFGFDDPVDDDDSLIVLSDLLTYEGAL